jgi:hypothetical protein
MSELILEDWDFVVKVFVWLEMFKEILLRSLDNDLKRKTENFSMILVKIIYYDLTVHRLKC